MQTVQQFTVYVIDIFNPFAELCTEHWRKEKPDKNWRKLQ